MEIRVLVQIVAVPHSTEKRHAQYRVDEEEQQQQSKHVAQRRQGLHNCIPQHLNPPGLPQDPEHSYTQVNGTVRIFPCKLCGRLGGEGKPH